MVVVHDFCDSFLQLAVLCSLRCFCKVSFLNLINFGILLIHFGSCILQMHFW